MTHRWTIHDYAYSINLYVAGDISSIERVCSGHCDVSRLCVSVSKTTHFYTGGYEYGAIVRVSNHPLFPKSRDRLWDAAAGLAHKLLADLKNQRILIEDDVQVRWMTTCGQPLPVGEMGNMHVDSVDFFPLGVRIACDVNYNADTEFVIQYLESLFGTAAPSMDYPIRYRICLAADMPPDYSDAELFKRIRQARVEWRRRRGRDKGA